MTLRPFHLKIAMAAALLFLAAYFAGAVFGENGLADLNRKQSRLEKIRTENDRLEKENRDLYRRVSRMKTDPVYLEHVIRHQLSVVGSDQIVFKFASDN
jgi:cell division protein FtsB